jgi:hypothetical protein
LRIVAKPIKMLAVFDEKGVPSPLRFQVKKNENWRIVKVDKIVSSETIRPSGMEALVFCCQSEIKGVLKKYEIVFRVKPHLWELYRI